MRRRDFLVSVGMTVVGARRAMSQTRAKQWRIGFLAGGAPPSDVERHHLGGLLQGLRERGRVLGRDFVIEARYADGDFTRFPALAADLIAAKVDLIVVGTPAAIRPVQNADPAIPIVVGYSTDLVRNGFVQSIARPGGSITGLESSVEETATKQFELLGIVLPGLKKVGVLVNPLSPNSLVLKEAHTRAERNGLTIVQADARTPMEVEGAMRAIAGAHVGAFVTVSDSVFSRQRKQIAELAIQYGLPSMFSQREYVEAGGLMSYGDSLRSFLLHSAYFVNRIMEGAKPGDLPIERPTQFHLTVNAKTAKTLGLNIPDLVLLRADEVIE